MKEGKIGPENTNKSKPLQLVITTNISLFAKRAPK